MNDPKKFRDTVGISVKEIGEVMDRFAVRLAEASKIPASRFWQKPGVKDDS